MSEKIICPSCHTSFEISTDVLNSITSQIKTIEFNKALEEEKNKLHLIQKMEIEKVKNDSEKQYYSEIQTLKDTIAALKSNLLNIETEKKLALIENSKIIQEESIKKEQQYLEKIASLEADKKLEQNKYEILLSEAKKETEFYKDLKTKMSTKMIGETLEQHCETQFNQIRMTAFPHAYFEKDNDIKTGSKGDYIFREYDASGVEIISIMFEMKNEADLTITKHKNKDFFKELDKDRKEKNCEYAILVSLLESDNELYNAGIVDVSYEYEKMYVIRPQCFIPMITLLRNAALNSLAYKKELSIVKNQELDFAHFEENLLGFKTAFTKNYDLAHNHFNKAIDEIDKSIKSLEAIKEYLTKSDRQYRLASDKVSDVTIKKLTNGAPNIAEKFKKINRN